MRVSDLLRMSTGHQTEPARTPNEPWTKTLIARFDGVEQRAACGRGVWEKGRMAWGSLPQQPAAASGAWTADNTFTARICFYETPYIVTVRLKLSGKELHCDSELNVGSGPTKEPLLVGKAE